VSEFYDALWALLIGYGIYFILAFVATCFWIRKELRADEATAARAINWISE
jgi:hypothetical protein